VVFADTAKTHDSQHFEALIKDELCGVDRFGNFCGGEVFADSAYASKRHTALLDAHYIHDGTIKRRVRGQAELPWWQQKINQSHAKIRAIVEHPLAWIKHHMGHRRVRYRGL
jgi:hypothetical protein